MVHDQLRQLLQEHDCVTLPGLGGLMAETLPARIHPVRHTLSPPARRLAFNEKLRHDDGLLTAAVGRAMQLPVADLEPARTRVTTFTEELRAALREHRAAELRGLGTLRQAGPDAPVRFEPAAPGLLPLASSFGLPELVARPLQPEWAGVTASPPTLRSTGTRLRRLLGTGAEPFYRIATAAIVVLSLSATYFNLRLTPLERQVLAVETTAPQPQRASVTDALSAGPEATAVDAEAAYPTPEPVAAIASTPTPAPVPESAPVVERPAAPVIAAPVTITKPVVAVPAPKAALQPIVPATTATVTASTQRCYAIWNAFSSRRQAEKGAKEAARLGGPDAPVPTVLAPPRGSALWRVAVADFESPAEAAAALPALRARYHAAVWMLRK